MKQNFGKYNSEYLGLLIGLVFIIGTAATVFVYYTVDASDKNSLLTRANTIAQFVKPADIKALTGSEDDLENPTYQMLKEQFTKAKQQNYDTRFIYALGQHNGQIFFYLDSEDPDSEDYSAPGDVYFEASPQLRAMFQNKQSLLESDYTDRWGTWISALSVITDPSTDEVVAVVGMDISTESHQRAVWLATALSALITLFLLVILIIYWFSRKKEIVRMTMNAEMVSLASHEIRSPLNGISWAAQTLIKGTSGKLDKKQNDVLALIRNSSENMIGIVNDLLDLYSVNAKKVNPWEVFDLGGVVDDAAKNFELEARNRGVELVSSVTAASVKGDKVKIKRVINNIISNALKYSKPKGQVKIIVKKINGSVQISVADQGIGIPKADQEKIFGGFYRASNARLSSVKGTGLGLYYIKQVIESHGGRTWFTSEENKGSTFFISLRKL